MRTLWMVQGRIKDKKTGVWGDWFDVPRATGKTKEEAMERFDEPKANEGMGYGWCKSALDGHSGEQTRVVRLTVEEPKREEAPDDKA